MILDRNGFGIWSLISKKAFKAVFTRPDPNLTPEHIWSSLKKKEIGIYIHIPFCRGFCPACPYVRTLWEKSLADEYLKALENEIEIWGEALANLNLNVKIIDMHAGGGSPSLLEAEAYQRLLTRITRYCEIDEKAKFGIEANPEDINEKKASELIEAGIKEISIGVQSFYQNNLRVLGRRHNAEESLAAIRNARKAGFDFINIDMMYMLPGQKVEDWAKDLTIACEQDVTK